MFLGKTLAGVIIMHINHVSVLPVYKLKLCIYVQTYPDVPLGYFFCTLVTIISCHIHIDTARETEQINYPAAVWM